MTKGVGRRFAIARGFDICTEFNRISTLNDKAGCLLDRLDLLDTCLDQV